MALVIGALAAILGGCSGSTSQRPSTVASAPSVLQSKPQRVGFEELRLSIEKLYLNHPGIRTFTAREVEYTPRTRNKVLRVCHRGGREKDARTVAATRIAGCAPLIFFFYEYGRRNSAQEAIDVARQVYWYAATSIPGPIDVKTTLTRLLQSWSIP